jgi:tRNA uridine 5-carbamoylmethylation protein Kti12
LDDILANNRQRTGVQFVSEDIIRAMYNKFEKPDISHTWENNSIVVDSSKPFDEKQILDAVVHAFNNPPSPNDSIEDIERTIQEKVRFSLWKD